MSYRQSNIGYDEPNYDQNTNSNQTQGKKGGFFRGLRDNFIYILMLGAVISAILYSNKMFEPNAEDTEETVGENLEHSEGKAKRKFPVEVVYLVSAILGIFVTFMILGSKDYVKQAQDEANSTPKKAYAARMSKEEFERTTQDTTKKELEKLMQTPEFKKMYKEKGEDQKNWVWQSREKDKRVVYRERDYSDEEEDDHLSQLTVSDD